MNVVSYSNQCNYWPLNPMPIKFLGVKWPVQGVYEVQKRKNANPWSTLHMHIIGFVKGFWIRSYKKYTNGGNYHCNLKCYHLTFWSQVKCNHCFLFGFVFVLFQQKRGPQRSVNVVVSSAFLLTLMLVSIICTEVCYPMFLKYWQGKTSN